MSTPPIWAQNNALRTFGLTAFDHEGAARRIAEQLSGHMTPRRFRRAALAFRDTAIIERRADMLVGWRRAILAEKTSKQPDAVLGLAGFVPYCGAPGYGFRKQTLNVLIHQHALARLFERAIQPLERVASGLLSVGLIRSILLADLAESNVGFAVPFQRGRFVGSLVRIDDGGGSNPTHI